MHAPTRILVPITFDAAGRAALGAAAQLAALSAAQLRLVHVWYAPYAEQHIDTASIPNANGTLIERMRHEVVLELQQFVSSCGLETDAPNLRWSIHSGEPATQILSEITNQSCDWVVMGTHQRHGLAHWLNGSVAEQVLRHASCPVLIVPSAAESVGPRGNKQNGDNT
jgi:nucleotide-binding universal stress UspA family protein